MTDTPRIVSLDGVSVLYGRARALRDVTMTIGPGATGLLGPNGAGKSSLLKTLLGFVTPDTGALKVFDLDVRTSAREVRRRIGYMPESDAHIPGMTAVEFVSYCGQLCGLPEVDAIQRAHEVLQYVGLGEARYRRVETYSTGMKQRIKLAQALVHDPDVLFLDEPLTGTDPLARRDLMDIILGLAADGKSVVVSSHVLYEVQSLTQYIILLNRGRLVAEGSIRSIRDLIDKHPHKIVLVTDRYRELASRLVGWEDVEAVQVLRDQGGVLVETRQPDAFYARLPGLVADGTPIREVYSEDDSLEAVFKYLVK